MQPKETLKSLHPRNRHRARYDFPALSEAFPDLKKHLISNPKKEISIDFANPKAVKDLNRAILLYTYGVFWDIPDGYLCPPIPGRADYIHYVADVIASFNLQGIPRGESFRVLDIGVGANCIYPLIGCKEYGWNFVGVDIDEGAVTSAKNIVFLNHLESQIEIRFQKNSSFIFKSVVQEEEYFDLVVCNPPFHMSLLEASSGTKRKWKNLRLKTNVLNFGGKGSELWCPGGEIAFIQRMIEESLLFKKTIRFFSTLVSKGENLPFIYSMLKSVGASFVETVEMSQGQKKSRIVVWMFSSA